MRRWTAKVIISTERARILVMDRAGNDVLKATLPPYPKHPRALLAVLEAVAQWAGGRITCVISVAPEFPNSLDPERWEADLCTSGSASVELEYARFTKGQRLTRLGDFSDVRALEPLGAA